MRILQVNKFHYRRGGAEAYMEDLAALQEQAGHEVAFFAMAHPDNHPSRYAPHFPSQVDFEPPPAGVAGKLLGAGRMLWSTSAARGIAAVLADFRPDVVHLHNIYHQLSPSILRPIARLGIPAVMTLHDYKLACPTHNFLSHGRACEACLGGHFTAAVRRRCQGGSLAASAMAAGELAVHTRLRSYDPVAVFICPSEFMVRKMTEAGVFPDRLRRLNHFVSARAAAKTAPGAGVVYVGRLSVEKGVDVLVRAAADLPPGVAVDIVGDGPERAALERLAAEVAPGRVSFRGRVAQAAVADVLRAAAVCVLPSRCYENQPLAVLESYTVGTPVVGARIGGIPELVRPGVTGELFTVDDPADLARVLGGLLADPQRAHRMGAAGRAWVEADFTAAGHLAAMTDLYAQAGVPVPVAG